MPTALTLILQFGARLRSAHTLALTSGALLTGLLGHQLARGAGLGSSSVRVGLRVNEDRVSRIAGYAVPMVLMVAFGVEAVTSVRLFFLLLSSADLYGCG